MSAHVNITERGIRIGIQVASVSDMIRTIAFLRRFDPDTSIAQLRARIVAGAPIFEYVPFGNDFVEVTAKIRALMQGIHESGATLTRYLLLEDERFEEVDPAACVMSVEGLDRILAYAEEYE